MLAAAKRLDSALPNSDPPLCVVVGVPNTEDWVVGVPNTDA